MDVKKAYCPSCEHEIRVTVTPSPSCSGGHANVGDGPQVVCLDFEEGCAEKSCPLSGLPPIVMGVRLARSGIEPERWKTVRGLCEGCGEIREMEVLDSTYSFCPMCRTTNRWTLIKLDDDSRVAVMEKQWVDEGGPSY